MLEAVLKGGGLRRGGLAPEAAALIPRRPSPGAAVARRPGRGIHGLLDGQVDPPVVIDPNDLDLDLLPLLEMILYIVDVGVGDLGDVNQPRFPLRQGHKGAKLCDPCDLSFQN